MTGHTRTTLVFIFILFIFSVVIQVQLTDRLILAKVGGRYSTPASRFSSSFPPNLFFVII
jgi:hypothetical protein